MEHGGGGPCGGGTDGAGPDPHDPVGQRQQRRPVHHEQDGPPDREAAYRLHHGRLCLAVQGRRRLVEQEHRPVRQERPRQRETLALPGGQTDPALAEERVRPRGRARTNSQAPASTRAAVTSASAAPGRASRTFSAIVPANRCGRCGTHAIRSRHCSGARPARSASAIRTRPAVGVTKPSST